MKIYKRKAEFYDMPLKAKVRNNLTVIGKSFICSCHKIVGCFNIRCGSADIRAERVGFNG